MMPMKSGKSEMKKSYLEITFRKGRPLAAYLYLPRKPEDRSHRTRRAAAGLIVDYAEDGRAIGIEITAPAKVSEVAINRVLEELGMEPLGHADLAPLEAA